MSRLSISDLNSLRERTRRDTYIREGDARGRLTIHMGTCGIKAGSRSIIKALLNEFEKREIRDLIIATSGCAGLCSKEPMMTVEIKGAAPVKYGGLTEEKALRILDEHAMGGKVVQEFALASGTVA